MTFKLYDHVRIKKNGLYGQIIDITSGKNGALLYTVESDTKGYRDDSDYPGVWPMYNCIGTEIEKAYD